MTRLSRLRLFPGVDVIGLLRKTCKNPVVRHALRNRANVCWPIVDKLDADNALSFCENTATGSKGVNSRIVRSAAAPIFFSSGAPKQALTPRLSMQRRAISQKPSNFCQEFLYGRVRLRFRGRIRAWSCGINVVLREVILFQRLSARL